MFTKNKGIKCILDFVIKAVFDIHINKLKTKRKLTKIKLLIYHYCEMFNLHLQPN